MKADTKHIYFFQTIILASLTLVTSCANDLGQSDKTGIPVSASSMGPQECPNGAMSLNLQRVNDQGELTVICEQQAETRSHSTSFTELSSDPVQNICTPWAKIDSLGEVSFACKEEFSASDLSMFNGSMLSPIAPYCSKVKGVSASCKTVPVMDGEVLARTLCLNGVDPSLQVPPGVSSVIVKTFPSVDGNVTLGFGQAGVLTQLNVPGASSSHNVMITLDASISGSGRSLVLGAGFKSQVKGIPKFSRYIGSNHSIDNIQYYSARRLGSGASELSQGGPIVFEWHYNSSSLGATLNEHGLSEEQFIAALTSRQHRHYVLEKFVDDFDGSALPSTQDAVLSYNLELNSQALLRSVNNAYQDFEYSETGVKAALGHSKNLGLQNIANFSSLYESLSTSEAFIYIDNNFDIAFGIQSILVKEKSSGQTKEVILAYLRHDNSDQTPSEAFFYSPEPMMSIEPNCAPKVKIWKHLEGETAHFDGNPAHRSYWLGDLRDCKSDGSKIPDKYYYQGVADVHSSMKQLERASHYGLKCDNEVGTVCVAQNGQGLGLFGHRGYRVLRHGGTYHKWECVEVEK